MYTLLDPATPLLEISPTAAFAQVFQDVCERISTEAYHPVTDQSKRVRVTVVSTDTGPWKVINQMVKNGVHTIVALAMIYSLRDPLHPPLKTLICS